MLAADKWIARRLAISDATNSDGSNGVATFSVSTGDGAVACTTGTTGFSSASALAVVSVVAVVFQPPFVTPSLF
jgi:hypothetical protein